MTVDVEDYFHVSVFDGVVPRHRVGQPGEPRLREHRASAAHLRRAGIRATFFVLGWVAERFPCAGARDRRRGARDRVARLRAPARLRPDAAPRFATTSGDRRTVLEAATAAPVMGYRAPSYSVTPRSLWALDVLIEEGFRYDASIFPDPSRSLRHPDLAAPSLPAAAGTARCSKRRARRSAGARSTCRSAAAAISASFPTRGRAGASRRLNVVERAPAIFYLHPWEIDPEQPRLPAPALGRFRHYCNLGKTEARLRALLGDFQFSTMVAVLEHAGYSVQRRHRRAAAVRLVATRE